MKLTTVKGVAIGAGLAYFLDPDRGRARRAALAGGLVAIARRLLGQPGRPREWEAPMMTIQIDVDDREAWGRQPPLDRSHAHAPRRWVQRRRRWAATHSGEPSV